MAQKDIGTLKQMFDDGVTPDGNSFADIFDSFFHKSTKLQQSQILGLNDELDKKANTEDVVLSLLYLPSVPTRDDLYTTYPNAKNGEASLVEDEGFIYQFRSDLNEWVKTPFMEFPEDVLTASKLSKNLGDATDVAPSEKAVTRALPLYTYSEKNLIDIKEVLQGKYQGNTGGSGEGSGILDGAGWLGILVVVPPSTVLTMSGESQRLDAGFYSDNPIDNPSAVSYRYERKLTTFTTDANTRFLFINIESPTQKGYSKLQLEVGEKATDYEDFRLIVKSEIQGFAPMEAKTDEFIINEQTSTNILNPDYIKDGIFCYPGNGQEETNPNYGMYVFTVKPNEIYTGINVNVPNKVFRSVVFVDKDDKLVFGIDDATLVQFTVPDDSTITTVKANLYSPIGAPSTDYNKYGIFKDESPSYEDYYYKKTIALRNNYATSIKSNNDLASIVDINNRVPQLIHEDELVKDIKFKTDVFKIEEVETANRLNPNDILYNNILYIWGALQTSNDYSVSGYFQVSPNTTYTGINLNVPNKIFRQVVFYDINKMVIAEDGIDINASITKFTVPNNPNIAYCRTTLYGGETTDFTQYGIFEGENPTFELYGGSKAILIEKKETSQKINNEVATIADINNIVAKTNAIDSLLSVNINNTELKISDTVGRNIVGVIKENRSYWGNNMFNFKSWSYGGQSGQNGDDSAPMHIMNSTFGANHGQPTRRATVEAHGLTSADEGTEWLSSSGQKFYLMAVMSPNHLNFLSANLGTEISPAFTFLTVGTLTRTIDNKAIIVTEVVAHQVFNSIKNLSLKVLRNGNELIADNADYHADYVDVVENYDIINTDSLLKDVIANAGNRNTVYDGNSAVRVENIYRFNSDLTVFVIANVIGLRETQFQDMMFSQAIPITTNIQSTSLKYYIPNSLPIAGYDFRKPISVPWSNSVPRIYVARENWKDASNPPNRVIQIYGTVGFVLGFLTEYGVGKALQNYTDQTFELRNNTGKVYPHGVEGTKVGTIMKNGDIYNAVMYRKFIDMSTAKEGRMFYYNFTFNNINYLYVDYSASMLDHIELTNKLNGKKIEIVEAVNTQLKNDVYNNGVYISATYVEEDTCYIVLKIY